MAWLLFIKKKVRLTMLVNNSFSFIKENQKSLDTRIRRRHKNIVTWSPKKVVLTAWELVVVKSVSVRPASVSLECWYLTERKHVAFLSSSSYFWKYSRNTSMMKLSVFTLRISSWQGGKISVSISCSKKQGFFNNLSWY